MTVEEKVLNRRGFLRRIGAAAIALTLARHLPGIAPAPVAVPEPETIAIGGSQTFKEGDTFTISGHYVVNPRGSGELQQFVVIGVVGATLTGYLKP